jgi:hypothetical protein
MIRSSENGMMSATILDPANEEPVMKTPVHLDERQWFHRLQTVGREQHAVEVKRMTRAELRRYMAYLRELQKVSIEEYRTMFGAPLRADGSIRSNG